MEFLRRRRRRHFGDELFEEASTKEESGQVHLLCACVCVCEWERVYIHSFIHRLSEFFAKRKLPANVSGAQTTALLIFRAKWLCALLSFSNDSLLLAHKSLPKGTH